MREGPASAACSPPAGQADSRALIADVFVRILLSPVSAVLKFCLTVPCPVILKCSAALSSVLQACIRLLMCRPAVGASVRPSYSAKTCIRTSLTSAVVIPSWAYLAGGDAADGRDCGSRRKGRLRSHETAGAGIAGCPRHPLTYERSFRVSIISRTLMAKQCGGRASNPRTPMGTGLKPVAFGLAWLPPPISDALCVFIFILLRGSCAL